MASSLIECPVCRFCVFMANGAINRARRAGLQLYCGRECAGAARRQNRSPEEQKAIKAAYDREYRAKNLDAIKAKKAAHFKRTYDPVRAAEDRKARMPRHVEYCQRPEYKAYKREYDREHRAVKQYGPFSDAFLALQDLENEIANRATRAEIYATNGTANKALQRKRDYAKALGR